MVPSLQPGGAAVPVATPDSKAGKTAAAAREFEAILLQDWLEKMNETFVGVEKSTDPAQGTVNSLASQTIATAVANRGGIGIANLLLKHLLPRAAAEATGGPPPGLPPQTKSVLPEQFKKEP
ncbi:MAG TPA: hypothetical protein VMD98_08730 [Bryocella sp.]|nr:hypothetical protein [Bryocella sp.]